MFSFNGLQRYEEFSEYNEIQPENLNLLLQVKEIASGQARITPVRRYFFCQMNDRMIQKSFLHKNFMLTEKNK